MGSINHRSGKHLRIKLLLSFFDELYSWDSETGKLVPEVIAYNAINTIIKGLKEK